MRICLMATSSNFTGYFKAELLREGIIFLNLLFSRAILLMKKLKIEETKATWYSTFITDIIKMGLVFSIFNFFINKISQANNRSVVYLH